MKKKNPVVHAARRLKLAALKESPLSHRAVGFSPRTKTKARRIPRLATIAFLVLAARASAPLTAQDQLFEQTDVFVAGEDGVTEYRIPVLVTANDGSLLAICDARVNRTGDAPNNIDIVMKRSMDGGRSWGALKVLADVGEGAAADSCAVVDRHTGTIWVFFGYYPVGIGSRNARPGLYGPTVMLWSVKSENNGRTWSKPIDVTAMVKKPEWRAGSPGPGVGIQTRSGRLIIPRYYLVGLDYYGSHVMYSDDHGETWRIGGEVQAEGKTNESQLVELADGSLLINMRGQFENHRKTARSIDGGMSWREVSADPTLIEPRCQASLLGFTDRLLYAKDRILFSNPADRERRNMTVRLSYDEGKSWPVAKQLHGGPSAYSCLTVLSDMTIGCLYERGDETPYEKITFAHFDIEWLTNGEDSLSPNSPPGR